MRQYYKTVLFASWGGVLFTGIILGSRIFTDDWILLEPYPYFLWFPSWWVCFTLFMIVFVITAAADKKKIEYGMAAAANGIIAFLGSLLTGRYMVDVLLSQQLTTENIGYIVLFPWSLYVFILFAVTFVFSTAYLLFIPRQNNNS
ncbi:MAG: hypothetical protein U9Q03_04585 [Patescibacteria group bacterium]|nr:hypothetical protein [Patescibacteria group bacterium]